MTTKEMTTGTRIFDAQAGVPLTVNLVCNSQANNTGRIGETWLTADLLPE